MNGDRNDIRGLYHCPVMLKESVEYLVTDVNGVYVDVTFGGGGHSSEILSRMGASGRLVVFDVDKDAVDNLPDDDRVVFIHQNYRYLWNYLNYLEVIPVDGVIADLGISSHQIDEAERGFSTRGDGELDMRMNVNSGMTAADVINTYSEDDLCRIFTLYGEVERPMALVKNIVAAREEKAIKTTEHLKNIVLQSAPKNKEYKYLSQVFQAVRIEVNDELASLEAMLLQLPEVLKVGGRAVVISYHSLEDRLVKNMFKSGNLKGEEVKDFYGNKITPFEMITRKPLTPSNDETERNNRARSAKLRVAEKK